MKIKKYLLIAMLGALGLGNIAAAEGHVITVRQLDSVQDMQAKSIIQGVKVGKLTPREATKLRDEQAEIRALENAMLSNGSLEAAELGILFKRLEESRININKLLHNHISTHHQTEKVGSNYKTSDNKL